jgi:single-strand DNA-binding protein
MKNVRNFVQLIGNLGQDVDLKEFESGKKKASFSVAINDYFTSNDGQKTEKTEWHNIVAWGNLAEKMTVSLGKGDQVLIQGSISNRRYEDNSGATRYITEIIAGDFVKIAKKQ